MDDHKKALFKGAVDLHIHTDPSFMKRTDDAIGVANKAAQVGMRAVCYKDHHLCTVQEAFLANKYCKRGELPFTAYGSYCMNHSQGGYNLDTLETAIRFGAKQVYLPTVSADKQHPLEHPAAQGKKQGSFMPMKAKPIDERPLSIYADGVSGDLAPALKDAIALIRDFDVILSTGHLALEDCYPVVKFAKEIGCKKILLTHFDVIRAQYALTPPYRRYTLEEMGEVQKAGNCFVEYAVSNRLYFYKAKDATPYHEVTDEARSAAIKYFGPDLVCMGTDNGSCYYPQIVEEYEMIFDDLIKYGWSDEDIHKMTSVNQCYLLGISEHEQDAYIQ